MRHSTATLFLAAATLAGCAAPTAHVAETFDTRPLGWLVLEPRRQSPATDLRVEHGRLRLDGARLLCQDHELRGDFAGLVDLSLAGAEPTGCFGVFVQRVGPDGSTDLVSTYSLAVNARGEWRASLGNPLTPPGSRWKALRGVSIVEPMRFLFDREGGRLRIRIAGDPGAAHTIELAPTAAAADPGGSSPASDGPGFRVGVFTYLLGVCVDNFIVGESSPGRVFEPGRFVVPGGSSEGGRLLALANRRAAELVTAPRRDAFVATTETYRAARRAFEEAGDRDGVERVRHALRELLTMQRDAVEAAGVGDLLPLLATSWNLDAGARADLVDREYDSLLERADEAGGRGDAASSLVLLLAAREIRREAALESRIDALSREVLRPLRIAVDAPAARRPADRSVDESTGTRPLAVSLAALAVPATEEYGRLPRARDGELGIRLAIERAIVEHDRRPATRRIVLSESASRMTQSMRDEIVRLERALPEDLRDARARAMTLRAGELTPELERDIRRVSFPELGHKNVEVLVTDVGELARDYDRLVELRRLEKVADVTSRAERVGATSVTDVVTVSVRYELRLRDRVLIEGTARALEGLEQWEHAANPRRGVPLAKYDPAAVSGLETRVLERVAKRLRTALSRAALFAKLSAEEGTELLIRMARSTGDVRDRAALKWRLQRLHGLSGLRLDAVVRALVSR